MSDSIRGRYDLTGKVAVVTGASKGIGEAIARGLAEFGAKVVLSSRRQEAVDKAAGRLCDQGLEASAIACHVGRPEQLGPLIEQTAERYGGIDILINNAAINPVFGPLMESDDKVFDKIIDVNLRAPLNLAKRVVPLMEQRGGGTIINVASIGALRPEPLLGLYSVSKSALISLTQVMAKEWGPAGIRVNAICPGLVKTKLSEALWQNEELVTETLRQQPIKRLGEPEDIAGLAVYLASDASGYTTGAVHVADGGFII